MEERSQQDFAGTLEQSRQGLPVSDFLKVLETKTYIHFPCGLLGALAKSLSKTECLLYSYFWALAFFEKQCGSGQRCAVVSYRTLANRLGRGKGALRQAIKNLSKKRFLNIEARVDHYGLSIVNRYFVDLPSEIKSRLLQGATKPGAIDQAFENHLETIEETKCSFQIPFHLLLQIIGDRKLSQSAKCLWLFLYETGHANLKTTGSCDAILSIAEIGKHMGLKRASVFSALKRLETQSYLVRKRISIGCLAEKIQFTVLLPEPISIALHQAGDRSPKIAQKKDTNLPTKNVDHLAQQAVPKPASPEKCRGVVQKNAPLIHQSSLQQSNNNYLGENQAIARVEAQWVDKPKTVISKKSIPKSSAAALDAKAIFERFEKNAIKLVQAGFTHLDAKRLSATNLNEAEKNILYEAALQAQQSGGCLKLRSLLLCPKTRFAVFGSGVDEAKGIETCQQVDLVLAQACQTKTLDIPAKPLQKKSGHMPLKFEEIVSLEAEDLLETKQLRQLDFHLNRMEKNGLLKGYAKHVPIGMLRTEVAFTAATFPMRSLKAGSNRTALAIAIACRKMREGDWACPWGLPKVRERLWQAEKKRLYGRLRTEQNEV